MSRSAKHVQTLVDREKQSGFVPLPEFARTVARKEADIHHAVNRCQIKAKRVGWRVFIHLSEVSKWTSQSLQAVGQ